MQQSIDIEGNTYFIHYRDNAFICLLMSKIQYGTGMSLLGITAL